MRFAAFFLTLPLLAQQAAPKIPDNVKLEPSVAYDTADPQQVMDIFRPTDGATHPAVLFIHGGGFRAGSRKSYFQQCIRLAQLGYVTATMDYRLAPKAPFPAAVYDTKAAVRYLRANASRLSLDPQKIGVTGGSAGGHLVLFLGVTGNVPEFEGTGPNRDQSSRVQCVVSMYGPSDFTKSYGRSVDAAEVLPLFLGGDLEHAREMHLRSSPLNWVTRTLRRHWPSRAPKIGTSTTSSRFGSSTDSWPRGCRRNSKPSKARIMDSRVRTWSARKSA